MDGDENSAAGHEGLENPAVVCLKSDAAHRAGEAEFRKIVRVPLQRLHHRPVQDRRSDPGDIQTASRYAERLLEQRGCLGRVLREHRQRRGRKARLNQRSDPPGRPRNVLKHPDSEPSSLDLNHGRVMYHEGAECEGAEWEGASVSTGWSASLPGERGCHVRHDVAIVGAGPAGARAAYLLARRGVRVTIFDGSHPREKPCGGGVTGRALALVADAVDPAMVPRTVIRSARFTCLRASAPAGHALSAESATVPLDGDALVVASRASFDAGLLAAAERAGAALVRLRVTNVSADSTGVTLTTADGRAHGASYVIGADGANSLVRRRLATAFRRDQLSIATGFFAHGVTSDEIVIALTPDPPGYIWSFPRPGHLAIGICAQADAGIGVEALRARTASWIVATGIANGATLEPYSWPIPSLSVRDFDALELAGPRWALAGDAAGLVDPITREGIFFALASGQWIADALLTGDDPAPRYASQVRDEAVSELTRAARLKAGFFRPAFTGLMMRALMDSGAIRSVMADLVAGRQSYASLKWRLLKTVEVGLAWRVLTTSD